jgi:hypothetical protein
MLQQKEKLHIPARNVRPYTAKQIGVDELAMLGIGMDEADIEQMVDFAMDNAQGLVTQASMSTPSQFLQNWMTGFVNVITAARKIDDLVGITTVGSIEDEEIIQGVMENTGIAVPYGDYTNVPFASWNANYVKRTVVRFEGGIRVGFLSEARAARARINDADSKRKSAAQTLEIQRNLVGFNGYNAGDGLTYGFLNDPNLPAYTTVNNGASASPLWSSKTMREIVKDIQTAIQALRAQSQDNIDPEKLEITLAVPTNAVDWLSTITDFGISVREWMKETYPKIRVVSAPQLNTANGGVGVFYLYAENVFDESSDDGRTFTQIVPAKFQVLGVQKLAKGYEEAYAAATAGVMCKRPYAVVRYSGIS